MISPTDFGRELVPAGCVCGVDLIDGLVARLIWVLLYRYVEKKKMTEIIYFTISETEEEEKHFSPLFLHLLSLK